MRIHVKLRRWRCFWSDWHENCKCVYIFWNAPLHLPIFAWFIYLKYCQAVCLLIPYTQQIVQNMQCKMRYKNQV